MKKILLALMLCMVSISEFAETIDTIKLDYNSSSDVKRRINLKHDFLSNEAVISFCVLFDYKTFINTSLDIDSIDFLCYSGIGVSVTVPYDGIIKYADISINESCTPLNLTNTPVGSGYASTQLINPVNGYSTEYDTYCYFHGKGKLDSITTEREMYGRERRIHYIRKDYSPAVLYIHFYIDEKQIGTYTYPSLLFTLTFNGGYYILPNIEQKYYSLVTNKKFNFRIYIDNQEENPTTEINNVNSNENTKQIKNGIFVIGTDNGDYNALGNKIK